MNARKGTAEMHRGECDFWCGEPATVTVQLVLRDFPPVNRRYCQAHALDVCALPYPRKSVRTANILDSPACAHSTETPGGDE